MTCSVGVQWSDVNAPPGGTDTPVEINITSQL